MSQYLPIFRAARLAGVSRGTLQRHIQDGELPTFEGKVAMDDLLRLYPQTAFDRDTEYQRVENIKAQAFSRRIRERILPNPEVMLERLNDIGHRLAKARLQLRRQDELLHETIQQLQAGKDSRGIARWLKDALLNTDTDTRQQDLITHDTVLRAMEAHIKLRPTGHEFWQTGNDTLLEAGLRTGLALNYGCSNGNCGLCKARLIQGEVKKVRPHDYTFSEAEKGMGYILMCSNAAVTDVELETLEARDSHDIPKQTLSAKVKSLESKSPNVFMLHLQTPRSQRLRFLAGQGVTLRLPNGERETHAIASCPCDDRNLIFHIPHRATSAFTTALAAIQKGDNIDITGPQGDFLLDEDSSRQQVFMVFGAGFAPLNSLIEHAIALDTFPALHLYWQADNKEAIYAHNLGRAWDDALENFHYHPMVKKDAVEHFLNHRKDIRHYEFYLSGNPVALKQAEYRLREAGVEEDRIKISEEY
jgi:CDP-4-dehydro-6-deoxyglucose reductase